MITYTHGNLLETQAEALVNTVNTVGVMGKGIALMFKERFPENYRLYAVGCESGQVRVGHVFITEVNELGGPRWIVNFPTKQHWRNKSKMIWIKGGLHDLRRFIVDNHVKSIAIPPLGAGNGGLSWREVKEQIEASLSDLPDTEIIVFEPTEAYQNVSKRSGVEKLTPARALIAELVRRYWILGIECSLLEIQKLAWFLECAIEKFTPEDNPLNLQFVAHKYGPYADRLRHLLNSLDGSYLHSEKRIGDSNPLDVIWFDDGQKDAVQAYLDTEAKPYEEALEYTARLIDGFESPYGLELLSTVDWLLRKEGIKPTVEAIREGLKHWPVRGAGKRKTKIFDDRSLEIALNRLINFDLAKVTV